jgi:predicted Zn-dependent protease
VLAHEIAHVKLGHAADYARSTAAGTNPDSADAETARVLSCVLTRDCGDPAGDALYGILANQNFARYAREQEAAVDEVAFGYLRGAGFNTLTDARRTLTGYRDPYNTGRRHGALHGLTPREFAATSVEVSKANPSFVLTE